ncbi:HEAT repeat domain-containing protein [Kribbella sp. DT2]|uniref:HEAT repeat domain-containing protein n=1 Tax=Kribbella sp. DT2 TaxID=3393427 RepID=UPI003CEA24A6
MRAADLLRSIDPLPYGERVRAIAEQALRLRGTPALDELLTDLAAGPADHRVIGLHIAQITGDAAYVTRLLHDPEPTVQSQALAAVGHWPRRPTPSPAGPAAVSDDELRILHDDAPAALRPRLLQVIRRTGRQLLAARLIDEQRDRWGDQYAAALLDSTDDQTVRRLLPELAYCLAPGQWERLTRRHPQPVLDHATETLPTGSDRDEWWQGVGYGVTAALDHDAPRAFTLIKAAIAPDNLPWAVVKVLGRLIDLDPTGVLTLLLSPDRASTLPRALTPAVRRRLHRYSDEDLTALGRALWGGSAGLAGLLSDLPPSRRAGVFTAVTADVELQQLPGDLLDVLPQATRTEQARRMLTLPDIAEESHRRWDITSYLPYDEASALLEPEITRPEAADRAAVYRAVVHAAGRSRQPASVHQALTWATRVRNDRDPVRQSVLEAAAALPPSVLNDDLVEPLQTLLTDALEARDTSWPSRAALTQLARQAIHQGAQRNQSALLGWGLDAHAALTQNRGRVDLDGIVDGLPRGREAAVYDALRPYLDSAAERTEFQLLFAVSTAFDKRAWSNDHLQGLLEVALWSNQEFTVGTAASHWLQPTATRAERVGRIIDRDLGMAQWDAVWSAIVTVRTDLLDAVLADPARSQLFTKNHAPWRVGGSTLRRWLPRQHRRYAEVVAAVADDSRLPEWTRAEAILMLGQLPTIGPAAVQPYLPNATTPEAEASAAEPGAVLLQEAALRALSWSDQPQLALPVLLQYAGTDRARVAVYAATRVARFVRPSTLPALLHPVLTGDGVKVTSRKEAARLLGELRAPGAAAVLTDAWSNAHRDVRAAITSAASQYLLHEPASWALLQQAVHDSAATATVLTQRTPYGLAGKYRSRYADLLIAVTNRAEPEVTRAAVLALQHWASWNNAAAPVIAAFITDLSSRTWTSATSALVGVVATNPDRGLDELVGSVRLLVRLENNPEVFNALPDRDHPARQRLTTLVDRLVSNLAHRSIEARQSLRPVADELTDPPYLQLRLKLLTTALYWPTLAQDLDALGNEVATRPLAAATAADLVAARLSTDSAHWTPQDVVAVAVDLSTRTDLTAGLFLQSLIATAGPRSGWQPAWRNLLVALRNHPAPDVRERALDLTTSPEN